MATLSSLLLQCPHCLQATQSERDKAAATAVAPAHCAACGGLSHVPMVVRNRGFGAGLLVAGVALGCSVAFELWWLLPVGALLAWLFQVLVFARTELVAMGVAPAIPNLPSRWMRRTAREVAGEVRFWGAIAAWIALFGK